MLRDGDGVLAELPEAGIRSDMQKLSPDCPEFTGDSPDVVGFDLGLRITFARRS